MPDLETIYKNLLAEYLRMIDTGENEEHVAAALRSLRIEIDRRCLLNRSGIDFNARAAAKKKWDKDFDLRSEFEGDFEAFFQYEAHKDKTTSHCGCGNKP